MEVYLKKSVSKTQDMGPMGFALLAIEPPKYIIQVCMGSSWPMKLLWVGHKTFLDFVKWALNALTPPLGHEDKAEFHIHTCSH
jgi:hypothetical protein